MNRSIFEEVAARLRSADAAYFDEVSARGDQELLHVARCFASSCSLCGDNGSLWSSPIFIPFQVIAMEPLAPVFSLSAIETVLRCGLPEGMEVRMFPEPKSMSQVLDMSPVAALHYAQEAAMSALDGNMLYGHMAFQPKNDVQRIGDLYVHHIIIAGNLHVTGDRQRPSALRQIDFETRAKIAAFLAEEIGVNAGLQKPVVLIGDIATYQTVHTIAAETRNYAAMFAVAKQGVPEIGYTFAGATDDRQYLEYIVKDPFGRILFTAEVPIARESSFHMQGRYIEERYGMKWRNMDTSRAN